MSDITENDFNYTDGGYSIAVARTATHEITRVNDPYCEPYDACTDGAGCFMMSGAGSTCDWLRTYITYDWHERTTGTWHNGNVYEAAAKSLLDIWADFILDQRYKQIPGVAEVRKWLAGEIRKAGRSYRSCAYSFLFDITDDHAYDIIHMITEFAPVITGEVCGYSQGECSDYVRWFSLHDCRRIFIDCESTDDAARLYLIANKAKLTDNLKRVQEIANEGIIGNTYAISVRLRAHDLWIKRFGECGWAQRWADARYGDTDSCSGHYGEAAAAAYANDMVDGVNPTPFWRAMRQFFGGYWRDCLHCTRRTFTGAVKFE